MGQWTVIEGFQKQSPTSIHLSVLRYSSESFKFSRVLRICPLTSISRVQHVIAVSLAFSASDQITVLQLFGWQSYLRSVLLKFDLNFKLNIVTLTHDRGISFGAKNRGLTPFFVGVLYIF